MSAGRFSRSKYESNNGEIFPIRVQPETEAATFGGAANVPPAAAADQPVSARVGGGNRQIGIKARSVTVTWSGAPPAGYTEGQLIRIPILTEDLYDSISPQSTTGSYLGAGIVVVGVNPERRR